MGRPGYVHRPDGRTIWVPDREAYLLQHPWTAAATAICIARDEADRARSIAANLKAKETAGPAYKAVKGSAFAAAAASVASAASGGKAASSVSVDDDNGNEEEDGMSVCSSNEKAGEMPVCGCLGSGTVPVTCGCCAGKGLSGSAEWAPCFACQGIGFVMRLCTNPQCSNRNNNNTSDTKTKSSGKRSGSAAGSTVSAASSGGRR